MSESLLDVTFNQGEYTLILGSDGAMSALRHGEPWGRDLTGDKLVSAFAHDLGTARDALKAVAEAVYGTSDREPHAFADYDDAVALKRQARQARAPHPEYAANEIGNESYSLVIRSCDAKYTLLQKADGALSANRHGEPWRDLTGDKMIGALAVELEETRDVLYKLAGETYGYQVGDEPDVYANEALLIEMRDNVLRLLPHLDLRDAASRPLPSVG